MRRRHFLALAPAVLRAAPPWRRYVEICAATLLSKGLDRYGRTHTPAWAGVIDTRDWSVPEKGVPAAPGIRESDRAVGGANLYHDSVTLRVLQTLSPQTKTAATEYMRWFLTACQSPATGLLAWGEHLYYDFFRDAVAVERRSHELLEWTAPWDLLWAVNSKAVTAAIAGLRYHHFDGPDTLYNRHAYFARAEHQKPEGAQPWIKHSAAYAHAFAFLYSKTRDARWLEWANADAAIYWDRRNPQTNLTLSCIDDPRPGSKMASGGVALLAYWLRKAAALVPTADHLRQRAATLLHAWEQCSYDTANKGWRGALHTDGTPAGKQLTTPWNFAYGESELLPYGRIAAYFAAIDNDALMLDTARRVARTARAAEIPANASIEGLGMALNLAVDLHQLEPTAGWLNHAHYYATRATERYWVQSGPNGLFVRLPADPFYEAKTGVGFLLAGLLRYDSALAGNTLPGDWTL